MNGLKELEDWMLDHYDPSDSNQTYRLGELVLSCYGIAVCERRADHWVEDTCKDAKILTAIYAWSNWIMRQQLFEQGLAEDMEHARSVISEMVYGKK